MKKSHVGEVNYVKGTNARMMITECKSEKDMTVQVNVLPLPISDPIVVKHVAYKDFLLGILPVDIDHLGETVTTKQGSVLELVVFRDYNDVDVYNRDTKRTTRHITYDTFRQGEVKAPKNHISEMRRMKSGIRATIIDFNDENDIAVMLQTGLILKKQTYDDFLAGDIKLVGTYNPNLRYDRIGEKRLSGSGKWMMIVGYRGTHHVDILFEDGFLVLDKDYRNFRIGEIQSKIGRKRKKYRKGEAKTDKRGNTVKIVEYNKAVDLVVEITDKDGKTRKKRTTYQGYTKL